MEPKKKMSFPLKVAVISAITGILIFFLLMVIMAVVYFSYCCEPAGQT